MTHAPSLRPVLPGSKPWTTAFWLCAATVLGQAILGEAFYKAHVGPLFLSELAVLLGWLVVTPSILQRMALPRVPWLRMFLGLGFGYLVYSLVTDRQLYWILRQSCFILYASVASFSYVVFRRYRATLDLPRLFATLGVVGGLGMVVAFFRLLHVKGNIDYTSTLLFLVGYAYWITRARTAPGKLLVGLAATGLVATFNGHSSFMPGAALILFLSLFLHFGALRMPLLVVGGIGAVVASGLNSQYSDANATWRYRYWHAILQDSWERGVFMLGKGFGVQYLPANAEEFEKIISQVSTIDMPDRAFQLMTVPPHNGMLTILIYLGLPGIVLFLAPLVIGLLRTVRRQASALSVTLVLALFGMLVLMMTNQSLEFPYVAICFWLVYGAYLASLQTDRLA